MITVKNLSSLRYFGSLHDNLWPVLEHLLATWPAAHDCIVTRVGERDDNQKTEVHTDGPPHRAIDFRISNLPEQTADRVAASLNSHFTYDPARPGMKVAIVHDAGSGNHLHVQVHANTVAP